MHLLGLSSENSTWKSICIYVMACWWMLMLQALEYNWPLQLRKISFWIVLIPKRMYQRTKINYQSQAINSLFVCWGVGWLGFFVCGVCFGLDNWFLQVSVTIVTPAGLLITKFVRTHGSFRAAEAGKQWRKCLGWAGNRNQKHQDDL